MANLCPEELKPLIEDYSRSAEQWKLDHKEAMACHNLENIICLGFSLFLHIDIIDVNWREAMLADKAEYSPSDEEEISGFYRAWLVPADSILMKIDQMEAAGYEVKWAEQFRRACREAKAIFMDDSEFFVGDLLVERRDQAIDAHQEGRTVEFHELGD